jgi:hypothetical protein
VVVRSLAKGPPLVSHSRGELVSELGDHHAMQVVRGIPHLNQSKMSVRARVPSLRVRVCLCGVRG